MQRRGGKRHTALRASYSAIERSLQTVIVVHFNMLGEGAENAHATVSVALAAVEFSRLGEEYFRCIAVH